jgi:hypothetical protein
MYTAHDQVAQFRSMAHKHWEHGIYPVDFEVLQSGLTSIDQFAQRISHLQRDIAEMLKTSS